MKLSLKQKKKIIAEHEAGQSYRTLAAKYKVCQRTIYNVIHGDEDFAEKIASKTNEDAEDAALSWYERAQKQSMTLIDMAMQLTLNDLQVASVRDRMGLVKILSECFCRNASQPKDAGKNALDRLCDSIEAIGEGKTHEQ